MITPMVWPIQHNCNARWMLILSLILLYHECLYAGPFQNAGNVLGFNHAAEHLAFTRTLPEFGTTFNDRVTMECWFSLNRLPRQGERFSLFNDEGLRIEITASQTGIPVVFFRICSGQWTTPTNINFDCANNQIPLNTDLDTNVWHHIAVMFDGPQRKWGFAIDGMVIWGEDEMEAPLPSKLDEPFLFGAQWAEDQSDKPCCLFDGRIDEFRISKRIRYPGISYAMPREPFQLDTSTIALFHFNENPGDTVFHSSVGPYYLIGLGKLTTVTTSNPLTPDFTFIPSVGQVPLDVQFTDKTAGTPTEWLWFFGDGNSSTKKNPLHTYAEASDSRNYSITLQVKIPGADPVMIRKVFSIAILDSLKTFSYPAFPPSMGTQLRLPESPGRLPLTAPSCSPLSNASLFAEPFTIEAWVKPYKFPSETGMNDCFKIIDVGGTYLCIVKLAGEQAIGFRIDKKDQNDTYGHNISDHFLYPYKYGTRLDSARWHHIAGIYDPANSRFGIGIDGHVDWSDKPLSAPIYRVNTMISIGGAGLNSFVGYVDDIRISNTALYSDTIYIVPSAPLAVSLNTGLLYHLDSLPHVNRLVNNAGNTCSIELVAPYSLGNHESLPSFAINPVLGNPPDNSIRLRNGMLVIAPELLSDGTTELTVLDMAGRTLVRQIIYRQNCNSYINIENALSAKGLYLLKVNRKNAIAIIKHVYK